MISILGLVDIQRDNTVSVATRFNHDDEIEWDKEGKALTLVTILDINHDDDSLRDVADCILQIILC